MPILVFTVGTYLLYVIFFILFVYNISKGEKYFRLDKRLMLIKNEEMTINCSFFYEDLDILFQLSLLILTYIQELSP